MKCFKDNKGVTWDIVINISQVKKLRDVLEVDLLSDDKGETFTRLYSDPVLLCNVLCVLCDKQAKERNVSEESFGEGLAGDSIAEATEAFLTELSDFSPLESKRVYLKKMLSKLKTMEEMIVNQADSRMDGVLDKALEQALKEIGE